MTKPEIVWINDDENGKWDHLWSHDKNLDCAIPYISLSSLRTFLEDKIKMHDNLIEGAINIDDESWELCERARSVAYENILQWLQPDNEVK